MLGLGGWLLYGGTDAPAPADPAAMTATRAQKGVPVPASRTAIEALPPPQPYRPDPAGAAMLRELKLAPVRTPGGVTGYVVTAADADLLAATPLREGDVLLVLEGLELDPTRLTGLAEELGEYDDVWVSFERDGKKQETLLELRRR